MQTTYSNDEKFLQSLDEKTRERFAAYISDLENEMNNMPVKPYDTPLHESTGLHCWFDFFKDGWTPLAAIQEDLSNVYE